METVEKNFEKTDSFPTQFALEIVIDKICQYLVITDLCHAAQVCRSWNLAAKRELQNRSFQRIFIYRSSNFSAYEVLRIKPYVALLFLQKDLKAFESHDQNKVCYEYNGQFPYVLIVVGSIAVITEKNIINTEEYHKYRSFRPLGFSEIPCLILPNNERLEVKVRWYKKEQIETVGAAKNLIDSLKPANTGFKSILMFFVFACSKNFIKRLIKNVKKSFKENMYAVWGGEIFSSRGSNCEVENINKGHMGLVGLSITGLNIDFYSTVIHCKNMKRSTFYQDLVNLKNNMKLKQYSMAFISGPIFKNSNVDSVDESNYETIHSRCDVFYKENYEAYFLYYLKKVFPNIPFISTFCYKTFKIFGTDSMNNSNQTFIHQEVLSIMFITYN